ncbi:response regulator [Phycicoccus sp. Root101]|uniref:response regulator n=1 Tax=Phycicoccus sp. Root101 TaxID=1736421 RepID=UPI0007035804|nr:response regulator transcription factor [Phycicoccus sp. Root101]KQU69255.1 LuxR family transcriptional regulator [Phycicoccus sp. Root101]
MTTTLVVVDDQILIRDGIAAILDAEADFAVVGTAADGAEAVGLVTTLAPDIALMDIRMPDVDGIEATRQIVESGSATRIIILTTFGADDLVLAALRAGASGYLLKDTPRASLVAAIRSVAAGEAAVEKQVLDRLVNARPAPPHPETAQVLARLSPRETEVLTLVARGATNPEIARQLFIGETTVKTHVSRIQAKLGARDRVQLVVMAHRAGAT